LIAAYPAAVRELADAAREALATALPGATESVDKPAKLLSYSYGRGYKGLVCTMLMSKTGVKLGIFRGAELPDPAHLLQGSGKVHRHVQLRNAADLERPELKRLLDAALAAFRVRDAERHFATAAKMAQRFPGVEVSTSYGTPAMKVKGKFMARLRTEAEGWLAIKCAFIDREILLQAAPRVFHLTPHYQSYPMVLVDLVAIEEGVLLEVVERAWRTTASEKAVRDWDAQHGYAAAGKPRLRKRRTLRKRAARR
jgi:hypothetical protein